MMNYKLKDETNRVLSVGSGYGVLLSGYGVLSQPQKSKLR